MQLGPAEILVILVVALLVFGPNKLPEIGRQVGRGVRELRKFQETIKGDLHEVFDEPEDHSGSAEPPPTLPPKDGALPLSEAGDDVAAVDEPAAPPTDTP